MSSASEKLVFNGNWAERRWDVSGFKTDGQDASVQVVSLSFCEQSGIIIYGYNSGIFLYVYI